MSNKSKEVSWEHPGSKVKWQAADCSNNLSMARLTSGGRVFGEEVQFDAGQLLAGKSVAGLPEQLQLADGRR